MTIQELIQNGNAILMLTPAMLQEYSLQVAQLVQEQHVHKEEKLYTPSQFAQRHGVDRSTLWRWRKAGLLKATIVGTKTYYKDKDLMTMEG